MTKLRFISLNIILAMLTAASSCSLRATLTVGKSGDSATVHVETLGEYPTTIRRIIIKDAFTGIEVFDLVAENGTPQIYDFRLSVGNNSTNIVNPEHGSYRVAVPAGKSQFFLQRGVLYDVSVWGENSRPRDVEFRF